MHLKEKLHVLLVAVNGLPNVNPSEFRFCLHACLNDETLMSPGGCVGLRTREGTLTYRREAVGPADPVIAVSSFERGRGAVLSFRFRLRTELSV